MSESERARLLQAAAGAVKLIVTIAVRRTELGGRASPLHCGYRACFKVPRKALWADATLLLEAPLAPGETGESLIWPHSEEFLQWFPAGAPFEIVEGSTVVGVGQVLAMES